MGAAVRYAQGHFKKMVVYREIASLCNRFRGLEQMELTRGRTSLVLRSVVTGLVCFVVVAMLLSMRLPQQIWLGVSVVIASIALLVMLAREDTDTEGEWVVQCALWPILINGRRHWGFYELRTVRAYHRGMKEQFFVLYPTISPVTIERRV